MAEPRRHRRMSSIIVLNVLHYPGSSPDSGHSQSQRQPLKILDPYGSTPRLEISERGSTMDLSKKSARLYQNYKGEKYIVMDRLS